MQKDHKIRVQYGNMSRLTDERCDTCFIIFLTIYIFYDNQVSEYKTLKTILQSKRKSLCKPWHKVAIYCVKL